MDATKDGIVKFNQVGPVVVVTFQRGRIREEREILKALEDLGKYIETHPRVNVLLNLSNIEYLSSAGLGNLVGLLKKARKTNGQFKLTNLQEAIIELFEVMRLTKIFEIFETEEAALASFSAAPAGQAAPASGQPAPAKAAAPQAPPAKPASGKPVSTR